MTPTSAAPLADIRVVDVSRALAGPHATMMLGDLGAHVIKVEQPSGDDTRYWGPPFAQPEASDRDAESTYFLSANRNKESIALDLKDKCDKAVLLELMGRADICVENFRPGVLDRLGLSHESLFALNPGLVVLSITGFGHDGPEGGRAGCDQVVQGEAGLMAVTGASSQEIYKVGVPIADLLAGMYGAFGVLAALVERQRTGTGQVVRTSLLASVIGVHGFQGTRWTVVGEHAAAEGNHHPSIAPYGLFRCKGGFVHVAVGSDGVWQRFCSTFELDPDEAAFATNADKVRNRSDLVRVIENIFSSWQPERLAARLADAGIPGGIVRTIDQVHEWSQVESQGLLIDVDHTTLGSLKLPGPPLRFFSTDGDEVTHRAHRAPPALDEHGERLRAWLNNG